MFRLCIIMRADNNDRGENVLVHNSNKRFSVGLNLSDEEDTIIAFLDKYCDYLTSVYFSLPLGLPYYSRKALIQEYESSENQEKLLRVCSYMKKLGIHREAAINKSNMTCSEIEQGIKYLKTYLPDVEEIVCLQEYARTLKEAFPHAELKYSFNNMTIRFDHTFDTYVLGKRYLRDMERRHEVLGQGFEVVLLLNNGCSFNCFAHICNPKDCQRVFRQNLERKSLDYLYAEQSFFPSELSRLQSGDPESYRYRFKLSTRPATTQMTSDMLDAYLGAIPEKEILRDYQHFCYFGALNRFTRRAQDLNLEQIYSYKQQMSV